MKKLNLFIWLFTGLMILSCKSEDDENNKNASILGEWTLVSETYQGIEESLSECELMQTLTFNVDGSLEVYYVDNEPCNFSTLNVEYTKNGNEFTISIEGEGENGGVYIVRFQILTLSETSLEFKDIWDNEEGNYSTDEQTTFEYRKTN